MARETLAAKTERAGRIAGALARAYPDARCELDYSTPLELLIATILSAQCTDKQVNRVTPALFHKYPTAAHYAGVAQAELEKDIGTLGFFRNKARSIRAACALLAQEHGGEVPPRMDALVQLPGVGRKTANVVLGNAFGINEGVVVDTHVARLSQRLGLSRQTEPEKIEQDLIRLVPRPQWALFAHQVIWHGRRRCAARRPDCAGCEVADLCPSRGRTGPRPRGRGTKRPT